MEARIEGGSRGTDESSGRGSRVSGAVAAAGIIFGDNLVNGGREINEEVLF